MTPTFEVRRVTIDVIFWRVEVDEGNEAMNAVGRWYVQPFLIASCGLLSLKLIPVVGIITCFILCNVALINGIRNRQRNFAMAGVTLAVIGLLWCVVLVALYFYSNLFVQGLPQIHHLS